MPQQPQPKPHSGHPEAPFCSAYDPNTRTPSLQLPSLSCDCHAHICGPADRFTYAQERIYTPPDALLADYLRMLDIIGIERTVLVQPSVYGCDNTVLLRALDECVIPCRGVAVIDQAVSDGELQEHHRSGIRGIRFNLVDVRDPSGRLDLSMVRTLAERIRALDWHCEFLLHADEYPELDSLFDDFPVDIVLAHMGYLKPPLSVENPGFQALLRLLRKGRCWVKLTGPMRISAGEMPYPDVTPIARELIDTAPNRILWGSDWPHVKISKKMPNDGDLVNLLEEWVPDTRLRRRILVDNPEKLYGF
ncbi:MAG: amidohydrolase family protein [Desulfuromonadales bacterium]|nr:amidohydrolase family protein [Desulfuromonadales bacterium]